MSHSLTGYEYLRYTLVSVAPIITAPMDCAMCVMGPAFRSGIPLA